MQISEFREQYTGLVTVFGGTTAKPSRDKHR